MRLIKLLVCNRNDLKYIFNLCPMFGNTLNAIFAQISRSSSPEVFYEKVFLKLSQNSHENTCAGVY